MRKLLPLSLLLCGAVPLVGCIQYQSGNPTLVVSVMGDGEGCRVTVNGQPVTNDRLLELGRAAHDRRGIVLYDKTTPFKCTGAAVATLQRAGLSFVDAAMWDGG